MPALGYSFKSCTARAVCPAARCSRASPKFGQSKQKSLQPLRALVGDTPNKLSESQHEASDDTRRHLHSTLIASDAPVQAPCPVLLSAAGRARNPGGLNTVLDSYKNQPADQLLPLHGGLPHPDAFPLSGLTFSLKSGQTLNINDAELVRAASVTSPASLKQIAEQ